MSRSLLPETIRYLSQFCVVSEETEEAGTYHMYYDTATREWYGKWDKSAGTTLLDDTVLTEQETAAFSPFFDWLVAEFPHGVDEHFIKYVVENIPIVARGVYLTRIDPFNHFRQARYSAPFYACVKYDLTGENYPVEFILIRQRTCE